jgi:hypothetical protein
VPKKRPVEVRIQRKKEELSRLQDEKRMEEIRLRQKMRKKV